MNYIREELLRQQELLVVLLTGRTVHTPSEELAAAEQEPWMGAALSSEGESRLLTEVELADDAIRRQKAAALAAQAALEPAEENVGGLDALWMAQETWLSGQARSRTDMLRTAAGRQSAAARRRNTLWGPQGIARRRMETENGSSPGIGAAEESAILTVGETLPAGMAETGEVRLVTELRQTEGGRLSDPAALSRAFQRDARRYDGGFRLY